MARARAGDNEAFSLLCERHRSLALGVARRMLGPVAMAEETVQEALLHAYLCLDRLREPERFAAWLCGIVLNLCRSHLRRNPTPALSLEALAGGLALDALPFASPDPGPEEIAEFHEQHRLVLAAVQSLSPKNRDAVLLFYYEQLSVAEVGALLGISVAAVKGRLHKSRRQLKEHLFSTDLRPDIPDASHREIVQQRREKMNPVTVLDVVINPANDHRVIVLHDTPGQRILPIWVGAYEGDMIARHLLGEKTERPMAYAFMASLLSAGGTVLEEVRVDALRGHTFYGTAKVRSGERTVEVDARPSDCIALALHTGSPILIAEEVMAASGAAIPPEVDVASLGRGLRQWKQGQMASEPAASPDPAAQIAEAEEAQRVFLAQLFSPPAD